MTMKIETFSLKDVREYVDTQLDMDAKIGDHLTVNEYMRMMELLIQLEQAESLARIADLLDGFRRNGVPVEPIARFS